MSADLSPLEFWQILQRRRALVLATTFSAALSASGLSLLMDPLYESKTQFIVSEANDAAATAGGLAAQARSLLPGGGDGAIAAYVPMLQSMAIRKLVVEQVGERQAKELGDFVDVVVTKKTTLQVRVLDRDPKLAQRLADAFPLALDRFLTELAAQRRDATLKALAQQRKEALRQTGEARERLANFLSSRKTTSVQREQEMVMGRWQQLQTEISTLQGRLAAIEQRMTVITAQIRDELANSAGMQSTHPVLSRLAREIAEHEVELAGALAEFDGEQGQLHPKVRVLRARLAEKHEQWARESAALGAAGVAPPETLREQMRRELMELQRQRAAARGEIDSKRSEIGSLRGGLEKEQSPRLEEQRLGQDIELVRRQTDTLTQRLAELQTQALRQDRNVVILNPAELAERPKFPSLPWNALLAALLGLVAGVYIALLSALSGRAKASTAVATASDGNGGGES